MKKILFGLMVCALLASCGIFGHKSSDQSCPANVNSTTDLPYAHGSCPPAAFGAEKLNSYLDKQDAHKKPTAKGDPITGKKTSVKKGIRTGELDKPVKLTRAQRKKKRLDEKYQRAEDKALERQIATDKKLEKTGGLPY